MKQLFIKYTEIINYLFWGVLTTVVSWGSFSLFSIIFNTFLKKTTLVVFLANLLSWVCATIFAFVTNKLWVFQSKSWSASVAVPELAKFVSSRMVTGGFELVAVPLLVKLGLNQTVFGIEGMLSKIIVSIVVVILNYLISKIFIFKQPKK